MTPGKKAIDSLRDREYYSEYEQWQLIEIRETIEIALREQAKQIFEGIRDRIKLVIESQINCESYGDCNEVNYELINMDFETVLNLEEKKWVKEE